MDLTIAVIACKTIGWRTIENRDYVRTATIRRDGLHKWIVYVTCDGVTEWYSPFQTKHAALRAYDAMLNSGGAEPQAERTGLASSKAIGLTDQERATLRVGLRTLIDERRESGWQDEQFQQYTMLLRRLEDMDR